MAQDVVVELDEPLAEALDEWIARHPEPRPTRAEAVVHLLSGVLGTRSPSSVVPNLITGRDIL